MFRPRSDLSLALVVWLALLAWVTPASGAPPGPSPNAGCATARHGELLDVVVAGRAAVFLGDVVDQRFDGGRDQAPLLVARASAIVRGDGVRAGDLVEVRGEPDGLKMPSPLDARITRPGARLLFACGPAGTFVRLAPEATAVVACLAAVDLERTTPPSVAPDDSAERRALRTKVTAACFGEAFRSAYARAFP